MPWDEVVNPEPIPVRDLKPGDVIDLEGDPIADGPCVDPNIHDDHALDGGEDACQANRQMRHENEYGVVVCVERETEDCIRLDFGDDDAYGFPVDHVLTRVGHNTDYDVRQIRVSQVSSEGTSIATAIGVDVESGERLAFHGDSRMLRNVAEAIKEAETEDDLPVCSVEDWQIA